MSTSTLTSNDNVIICGPLKLTSKFDSGNILKAELVEPTTATPSVSTSSPSGHRSSVPSFLPQNHDYEVNVWTRPDCYGTTFENGNRTWFYFGISGGKSGGIVKINVVNLNKQNKLFLQGMAPVCRILPEKTHWERVKGRITLNENKVVDNCCSISFRVRLPENSKSVLYIAFTYPFSYLELCDLLKILDAEFQNAKEPHGAGTPSKREIRTRSSSDNDIYYHRECVCYSFEGRRVELLTITSVYGMSENREDRLGNLFPIKDELRPFKFPEKKIIFLSARVHPGETPSSFVLNGFLKFILDKTDPRAVILRRLFVFKIIPILNPDGVFRGHYRTDPRGVNLNRVYLNPSQQLHPSIYAARKLLLYYHNGTDAGDDFEEIVENVVPPQATASSSCASLSCSFKGTGNMDAVTCSSNKLGEEINPAPEKCGSEDEAKGLKRTYTFVLSDNNSLCAGCVPFDDEAAQCGLVNSENREDIEPGLPVEADATIHQCAFEACDEDSVQYENLKMIENASKMEVDSKKSSCSDKTVLKPSSSTSLSKKRKKSARDKKGASGAKGSLTDLNVKPAKSNKVSRQENISAGIFPNMKLVGFPRPLRSSTAFRSSMSTSRYYDTSSGIFMYVDMHGHTTKRGFFMYGNHFPDVDTQAECMLVPRIMAMNSHHFDFAACNFTERLMCMKDRRDGASREGSGRVACLKLTGLIRSYTLECNYNTGRIVNNIVSRPLSCGFMDPSEPPASQPPMYTIETFEGIGKALAETILDMTGQNPWSRLSLTEFKTLEGVKRSLLSRLKLSPEYRSSYNEPQGKRNSVLGMEMPLISSGKVLKRPKSKILSPSQTGGPLGLRRENHLLATGSHLKKPFSKQTSTMAVPSTSSSGEISPAASRKSSLPKSVKKKLVKYSGKGKSVKSTKNINKDV